MPPRAESEPDAPPRVATEAEARRYLYGLDASDFVSARAALVKTIRAAGDKELAKTVNALRKPSVIAAELNRSLRAAGTELEQLLAAADDLRRGHRAMLAGEPVDLSGLQQRHRAVAADVAARAGRDRERIATILEAASLDETCDPQLRSGTFTVEPKPASGFELLAGAAIAPTRQNVASLDRARRRKARATSSTRTPKPLTGDEAEPKSRAREKAGGRETTSAEPPDAPAPTETDPAEIERAEHAVSLATRRADAARKKHTKAIERVAELERRLADARANLTETERAVEAAAAGLSTAEDRLAELSTEPTCG